MHPLDIDGVSNFNQAMIPLEVNRSVAALPSTVINLDIRLPDASEVIGDGTGNIAIDPDDPTTFNPSTNNFLV